MEISSAQPVVDSCAVPEAGRRGPERIVAQRKEATPPPPEIDDPIIGTTNAHLIIDRLSTGAVTLLGLPSRDLIGQSLLELVSPTDVLSLVRAAARSIETDNWTRLSVSLQRNDETTRCIIVLVPTRPVPSLMFALTDDSPYPRWLGRADSDTTGRESAATSLGHALEAAPDSDALELTQLSAREIEIVRRLFNGDRVPTIAGALFLSQSTVRNHLSAVFRKLGVRSQQELIHTLRDAGL